MKIERTAEIERIARICYDMDCAFAAATGRGDKLVWEEEVENYVLRTLYFRRNPTKTAADWHDRNLATIIDNGMQDAIGPLLLRPFSQLPPEAQTAQKLSVFLVRSLADG